MRYLAIVLAIILLWAGQAEAGERSPAPPPARAIPKATKPPEPPIFIGTELAETSWWISPGGAVVGYDDLIPERYNPSGEWQKIRPTKDCPWRIKVVPEAEAEKLMNEGWEPFGVIPIFDLDIRGNGDFHFYGNEQYKIYLKKRVCEEEP